MSKNPEIVIIVAKDSNYVSGFLRYVLKNDRKIPVLQQTCRKYDNILTGNEEKADIFHSILTQDLAIVHSRLKEQNHRCQPEGWGKCKNECRNVTTEIQCVTSMMRFALGYNNVCFVLFMSLRSLANAHQLDSRMRMEGQSGKSVYLE